MKDLQWAQSKMMVPLIWMDDLKAVSSEQMMADWKAVRSESMTADWKDVRSR